MVHWGVIRSIRHRALRRLYERDDASRLPPAQLQRIRTVLAYLDAARTPAELDLPGLRLHPLKGKLAGYWSVSISANWRIIFRLEDGDVCDVELVDYH